MTEFTKEELEWIKKSNKRMQIGDPLDEVNQRARSYVSMLEMQPADAQKGALQDFKNLDLKGITPVKGWKWTDTEPAFTRSTK